MSASTPQKRPNILMIMVDQMRFPRFGYGEEYGLVDPLKRILGFQDGVNDENTYKSMFPGFWALRDNAVVLRNHRIASSACVPSRTALFTGQYGTRTGVLQTDGVFKDGAKKNYCWLKANTFPTIGNWLRETGYETYYFGKWHITGEETRSLEAFGFSEWELSYPDPHGTLPNNLGHYRDYQFADLASSFLRRRGLGVPYSKATALANAGEAPTAPTPEDTPPAWFAVASFTNPHDIAAYPGLPAYVHTKRVNDASYTLAVPPRGTYSQLPFGGTMSIQLNKCDIPQNNANVCRSWDENLLNSNKPDCQLDYRYKMGLALSSKSGRLAAELMAEGKEAGMTLEERLNVATEYALNTATTGLPFALTDDPELASRAFMQYYGYLFSEVDQHIDKTLKALEESGQADNTIVIFCPDHGEYGGAHGNLMEKWHSAYDEVLHVPLVVRFPPGMQHIAGGLKQLDEATSHIDLLPTILGLAGIDEAELEVARENLSNNCDQNFENVMEPVGLDLSSLIRGESTELVDTAGKRREGVLFITHDTITEPLEIEPLTMQVEPAGMTHSDLLNGLQEPVLSSTRQNYIIFNNAVDLLKQSSQIQRSLKPELEAELEALAPGPVCQPNNVHAFISQDNWKLVRYFDPHECKADQYELYDLNKDPDERVNLVRYNKPFPRLVKNNDYNDFWLTRKAEEMMAHLDSAEKEML